MSITPSNLIKHELIGLKTHVVDSTDPGHICKSGTIVDESKEMLHVSTEGGTIHIPKSFCVFELQLPDGTHVRVDGNLLRGTPEDRLKKRQLGRW